jgi:hypothetical protein
VDQLDDGASGMAGGPIDGKTVAIVQLRSSIMKGECSVKYLTSQYRDTISTCCYSTELAGGWPVGRGLDGTLPSPWLSIPDSQREEKSCVY